MEAHLIERVHNPSPATFVSEFVNEGRPAIITGVVDCWPAAGRWTPEFLQQNYGEVPIKYEIWRGDADKNDPLEFHRSYTSAEKPMRDFVDLLRGESRSSQPCGSVQKAPSVPYTSTVPTTCSLSSTVESSGR